MKYTKAYIGFLEYKEYNKKLLLKQKQMVNKKILDNNISNSCDDMFDVRIQLIDFCIDNNYSYYDLQEKYN